MTNKLFSIEREKIHKVVTICGLKIKIPDNDHIKRFIKGLQDNLLIPNNRLFFYSNTHKLTYKEKNYFLSRRYYQTFGYFPNFKNPKTFNEKINWMKINYYNPNETRCIDKYEFKNYIKEKLGDGFTIPLIGVYEDVNDIDFDSLPDKFVIKTTCGGSLHGVKVVTNKKQLNIDKTKYNFCELMQDWNSVYYSCLSRGYLDIQPRIIIEEYMEQPNGQLYDYKFFCFHGEPKFVYTAIDHFPGVKSKISLFNLNWEKYDVQYDEHPNIKRKIEKPRNFDKMIEISKTLSKDFPFVRVDFYEINGKVYVGEMTFTPGGGFGVYHPSSFDAKMGEWLDLNKLNPDYLHIEPDFAESAKTFIAPQIVESCTVVRESNPSI